MLEGNDTTTSSGSEAPQTQNSPLSVLLGFDPGDHVSIASQGVRHARTIAVEDLDADEAFGDLPQADTWIGAQPVNPGTQGRASAGDVAELKVLYADFDLKEATSEQLGEAIAALSEVLGAEAWSIVDSGGGLHPRWKLAKPVAAEDSKGVLDRWKATVFRVAQEVGFKPDSVFDLPRVLRLPGTVNEKYDPPRPVRAIMGPDRELVPVAAIYSKLDQLRPKTKAERLPAPEGTVAPAGGIEKPEAPQSMLPERFVQAEIVHDMDTLASLERDGWTGQPWHNTCRDIAFRWAKIGQSPETVPTLAEMGAKFFELTPRDDEGFDDDKILDMWSSAVEKAEGEVFDLRVSGDDLFADEFDQIVSGAHQAPAPALDLGLFDDDGEPAPATSGSSDTRPATEVYENLPLPLIPGFSGLSSVRAEDLSTASPNLLRRVDAIGEDISDLHTLEHTRYMHPHCPLCFPDRWRSQFYHWIMVHNRYDSLGIRPQVSGLAPDEGYYSWEDLANMVDGDMLITGYIPTSSVGIINGRGSAGKTFLAVDMALSIIDPEREDWRRPLSVDEDDEFGTVHGKGGVLFLAGEGYVGVRDRFAAAMGYKPGDPIPDWLNDRLVIRPEVPNLFAGGADFEALLTHAARTRPHLIIVDTLQKASFGAEQNSASDMAIVNSRLSQLRHASGGTVLVIAHTDKADTSTRGSTAIEDDADFILHIEGKGDVRTLSVTKMRDGSAGPDYPFQIVSAGKSAVAKPLSSGDKVGQRGPRMIAVAKALYECHSAASFTDDITFTELKSQVGSDMDASTIRRGVSDLIEDDLVIKTQANKRNYQLTQRGRAWFEAQGQGIFLKDKQ